MYFDFSKAKRTPRQVKLEEIQTRFHHNTFYNGRKWFKCVYKIEDKSGKAKETTMNVYARGIPEAIKIGQVYGSVVAVYE